jgi:hypothetical protein
MLNKYFQIIHNRYYKFFRFIFFLRYLFIIFLLSITLFLTIPNFFNYENRAEIIKDSLIKNYNFEVIKYDLINFNAMPVPNLEFKNALINLGSKSTQLEVNNLKLFPKISNIYNYENFKLNKIELDENNIILKISDLNFFLQQILNKKNKLFFNNLNLEILDEKKSILKIKNIKFANYGSYKNSIKGEIFGKKFRAKFSDGFDNIKFKLLKSGVSADIILENIQKSGLLKGIFKAKILDINYKFNFSYENKILNIYNSLYRSKNLSFDHKSLIKFNPYLDIKSNFNVENINTQLFKNFDLNKIIENQNFIKKINIEKEINFKSEKFSRNLIEKLKLNFDLAYGRINYKKNISLLDTNFKCLGSINLLEEYPLLFFDCKILSKNKKKFFKKFNIKSKEKNEGFTIEVSGNLNILRNKINFKNILMNKNYEASKEDLKYFKEAFENILLDENLIKIISYKKIKDFILEIS